jgi:hypothetical protein
MAVGKELESFSMLLPTPARLAAVTIIAAAAMTSAAQAQRARAVPQAFAVVQAPESAVEACHATSAQAALDCAKRRCERKSRRGACFAVTACQPAGWAGVMGVQLSEVHFSTAVCGAPSREAALASLKAFCDGHAGGKSCVVSLLWSPDGKQHNVDARWTPQKH